MTKDVKRTNEGTSMQDIKNKIPLKKVVMSEQKTEVLRLNHMSRDCARHVAPHHRKNKKKPLICHHY